MDSSPLFFFEWLLFLKVSIRSDNENTGVINSLGESEIKAKRNSIRDMVREAAKKVVNA